MTHGACTTHCPARGRESDTCSLTTVEHIRQVLTERTQRTRPARTPCARSNAHARRSIVEGMAPPIPNEPEQAIPRSAAVRRWRREECTVHADPEAFFRHLDGLVDDDAPSGSETAR